MASKASRVLLVAWIANGRCKVFEKRITNMAIEIMAQHIAALSSKECVISDITVSE